MDQPGFGSRLPGTLAYKTSGGGSRLAKKIEIFGFNGLLTKPWRRGSADAQLHRRARQLPPSGGVERRVRLATRGTR